MTKKPSRGFRSRRIDLAKLREELLRAEEEAERTKQQKARSEFDRELEQRRAEIERQAKERPAPEQVVPESAYRRAKRRLFLWGRNPRLDVQELLKSFYAHEKRQVLDQEAFFGGGGIKWIKEKEKIPVGERFRKAGSVLERTWYAKLWSQKFAAQLAVLDEHFKGDFKGKSVLEVGFAEPVFLSVLRHFGAVPHGIEVSLRGHKKRVIREFNLAEGDGLRLGNSFKGKRFDAIVSSEVYEPFILGTPSAEVLQSAVNAMNRKLNNRGIVCIQTGWGISLSGEQFRKAGFKVLFEGISREAGRFMIVAVKEKEL